MGTSHVYVCDRCGKRVEGQFLSPGWCEIDLIHGLAEEIVDPTEPPEQETYLLCNDCAPRAVAGVRESVRDGGRTIPTH